jgi:hypothetical protein
MIRNIFLAGLGLLVFASCNKEDDVDTTAPTISITSPTNGQAFEHGDQITVSGTISDDVELSSLEIDIHHGEGHDHKSDGHNHGDEWEVEEKKDITGTSYTLNESFTIADGAEAGEYHIIVNAIDAAGNAAEFVEVDVEVK